MKRIWMLVFLVFLFVGCSSVPLDKPPTSDWKVLDFQGGQFIEVPWEEKYNR